MNVSLTCLCGLLKTRVHTQVRAFINFNGDVVYCIDIMEGNSAGVEVPVIVVLRKFSVYTFPKKDVSSYFVCLPMSGLIHNMCHS